MQTPLAPSRWAISTPTICHGWPSVRAVCAAGRRRPLANSASFWSPEGDLANGLVILGLYSDANPPPSNTPDVVQIDMPDGATIAYDHAAHALAVTLPAGGTATIAPPPGGATINGPVTINGPLAVNDDVSITGTATAADDVIGGGKSLKGHKHGNVQAGTSQTGAPI